jgi:hypothetical protein
MRFTQREPQKFSKRAKNEINKLKSTELKIRFHRINRNIDYFIPSNKDARLTLCLK